MDSKELFFEIETRKHQQQVSAYLIEFANALLARAVVHDESKLREPERSIFIEYTDKLKGVTYGSDEYKQYLKEMQVALVHHYGANPHHPEHSPYGIDSMDLVDVVEMLCDWKAATKRHADGDIHKSIDHNETRFGIAEQLSKVFRNTVTLFGWER